MDTVKDGIIKTCEKRGTSSSRALEKLCRPTIKKIEKRNDILTKKTEVGVQARIDGCNDKCHVTAFAGLNYWAHKKMRFKGTKCNSDGTVYTVGYEMKKKKVVKLKRINFKKKQSVKCAPEKDEPTTGLFSIKNYTLIFSCPAIAQPINIIENKEMKKGTYDMYKVPGLGFSVNPEDNFCWLVFTDDRSLTKEFYRWFITDCLVPTVQNIRKVYGLTVEDNMAFWQIDGENVQIQALFDLDIRKLLKENNIKVGKSSASTTEIEQECDIEVIFKGPKTRLKHLKYTHVDHNSDIYKRLKEIWKEQAFLYPIYSGELFCQHWYFTIQC